MMRRVIGFVVVLAIAVTVGLLRGGRAEKVEAKVDATQIKLAEVIKREKDSDKYAAFLDKHGESAHQYAMTVAYEPGGRRTPPKFDAAKYANAYCENLLVNAKRWKADDQALGFFVRQLAIDVESAAKAGEFE